MSTPRPQFAFLGINGALTANGEFVGRIADPQGDDALTRANTVLAAQGWTVPYWQHAGHGEWYAERIAR